MNLPFSFALALSTMAFAACERAAVAPAPVPAASVAPKVPQGRPQPKLPTIKLWVGPQEILAEQALTQDQIMTGMMFRESMAEHEGMLFVFGNADKRGFWMRNTLLPLTCAYIDPEGVILEIHNMKPLDETPIISSSDRIQYVLEMNKGWFERNKVTVGMSLRTERGSLQETYFRR